MKKGKLQHLRNEIVGNLQNVNNYKILKKPKPITQRNQDLLYNSSTSGSRQSKKSTNENDQCANHFFSHSESEELAMTRQKNEELQNTAIENSKEIHVLR